MSHQQWRFSTQRIAWGQSKSFYTYISIFSGLFLKLYHFLYFKGQIINTLANQLKKKEHYLLAFASMYIILQPSVATERSFLEAGWGGWLWLTAVVEEYWWNNKSHLLSPPLYLHIQGWNEAPSAHTLTLWKTAEFTLMPTFTAARETGDTGLSAFFSHVSHFCLSGDTESWKRECWFWAKTELDRMYT